MKERNESREIKLRELNKVNEDKNKISSQKWQNLSVHLQCGKIHFTRGALQDSIKRRECYHQDHYRVGRNQYCP